MLRSVLRAEFGRAGKNGFHEWLTREAEERGRGKISENLNKKINKTQNEKNKAKKQAK